MDKIIVDSFFISNNKNAESQHFNTIEQQSIFDCYCWLEEEGILKKVSFLYKRFIEEDGTYIEFALCTDKLKKYKKRMSCVANTEYAINCFFYKDIQPCFYCGGVTLLFSMLTYRDTGNVSKSWECTRCISRHTPKAYEVLEYRQTHSSQKTILKFWDDFGKKQPDDYEKVL